MIKSKYFSDSSNFLCLVNAIGAGGLIFLAFVPVIRYANLLLIFSYSLLLVSTLVLTLIQKRSDLLKKQILTLNKIPIVFSLGIMSFYRFYYLNLNFLIIGIFLISLVVHLMISEINLRSHLVCFFLATLLSLGLAKDTLILNLLLSLLFLFSLKTVNDHFESLFSLRLLYEKY